MVWLLLAIILAAIVYAVTVIGECNSFHRDIQPRIEALEAKCETLETKLQTETNLLHEDEMRFKELEEQVAEASRGVLVNEKDLKAMQKRGEQLETEKYKQEFSRSRGG